DPRDRAYWLQAVYEVCLHLLAAATISVRPVEAVQAEEEKQLSKRPSLGHLAKSASSFKRGDEPAVAAWSDASKLLRDLDATFKIVKALNEALHGFATEARPLQEPLYAACLANTAPHLAPAVFDAARGRALEITWNGEEATLGGSVRLAPGLLLKQSPSEGTEELFFYRGALHDATIRSTQLRWWSFSSGATLTANGDDVDPETLLDSSSGRETLRNAARAAASRAGLAPVQPRRFEIPRWPQPVAQALAKLRTNAQRSAASPVERWALADVALGLHLRFASFVAFANGWKEGLDVDDGRNPWLSKSNKRRQFERVRDASSDGPYAESFERIAGWVRGPNGARALRAIDALERIEHVVGPLGDHARLMEEAVDLTEAALEEAAFGEDMWLEALVGDERMRLMGFETPRRKSLAPESVGLGRPSATAAHYPVELRVGEQRVPLWPFVRLTVNGGASECWIAVEGKTKSRRRKSLAGYKLQLAAVTRCAMRFQATPELVADEGSPRGVRFGEP
ncbi:MAG: hypothetical protein FJ096_23015, partial [Deltaproteobacteria bacterium]|nr:hypothetical protein [Deltaproteobacteria bacterium]